MKDLKFICCQPDDSYYIWQVHLWLENLKMLNYIDKAIVLIFVPKERKYNTKWDRVITLYPEAEFVVYNDEHEIWKKIPVYIPVLRPYVLWRYFSEHPEMNDKAIFYYDCDVLLTEKFDISKFINDDVCYLSDTKSYINASYFDSKIKDVKPEKVEEYKNRDVLEEISSSVGINRQICELNNLHSGGAQYLLKNINADFWKNVMDNCITIRIGLQQINRQFFENENKGFQSWCADMWAVLWELWKRGKETKIVPEMDFAWATDLVTKLEKCPIFHNAGVSVPVEKLKDGQGNIIGERLYFYKGKYIAGIDPIKDPHFEKVLKSEESKKYCTWWYANKLKDLYNKYQLNY
jgi:hypothetical protein